MVTVTVCTVVLAAGFVMDQVSLDLAADVRTAMRRSCLDVNGLADLLGVSRPRLSRQLNGEDPFTFVCRFFTSRRLRQECPEFLSEFLELRAKRIDRVLVENTYLAGLVSGVEKLLAREQIKLTVPAEHGIRTVRVTLPLGSEKASSR